MVGTLCIEKPFFKYIILRACCDSPVLIVVSDVGRKGKEAGTYVESYSSLPHGDISGLFPMGMQYLLPFTCRGILPHIASAPLYSITHFRYGIISIIALSLTATCIKTSGFKKWWCLSGCVLQPISSSFTCLLYLRIFSMKVESLEINMICQLVMQVIPVKPATDFPGGCKWAEGNSQVL